MTIARKFTHHSLKCRFPSDVKGGYDVDEFSLYTSTQYVSNQANTCKTLSSQMIEYVGKFELCHLTVMINFESYIAKSWLNLVGL